MVVGRSRSAGNPGNISWKTEGCGDEIGKGAMIPSARPGEMMKPDTISYGTGSQEKLQEEGLKAQMADY